MTRVVLGVDPGTARCGWGLVAQEDGRLRMVDCGCVSTKAGEARAERLRLVHTQLSDVIRAHAPDEVAVEQLFFGRNVTTAISVGEARGVALLAAAQAGLPVSEYSPAKVKEALGSGRASKHEVRLMVMMGLGLEKAPRPDDVSDALAIAMCHIFWSQLAPR